MKKNTHSNLLFFILINIVLGCQPNSLLKTNTKSIIPIEKNTETITNIDNLSIAELRGFSTNKIQNLLFNKNKTAINPQIYINQGLLLNNSEKEFNLTEKLNSFSTKSFENISIFEKTFSGNDNKLNFSIDNTNIRYTFFIISENNTHLKISINGFTHKIDNNKIEGILLNTQSLRVIQAAE